MNPHPNAAQQAQTYLRTRVLTATAEQLQMMLFDGAIRFAEQARVALEKHDWENSYNSISRAQKIIAELTGSLRHDLAPDLCGKLASLYNFAYRRLIEANVDHRIDSLDAALGVLRYQRQTWALLLDQLGKQKAAATAATINIPAPSARMEATISMRG